MLDLDYFALNEQTQDNLLVLLISFHVYLLYHVYSCLGYNGNIIVMFFNCKS